MKATTWFLCPIVFTLFCATRLVCTAQRYAAYPLELTNLNALQDDYYWLDKRNKPSLSIVNPLDVLRQRLLLEIARRQMKENTRQVELNRAILKNVGKRMSNAAAANRYQLTMQQKQHDLQQRQHFPKQLDYLPTPSIFDLFNILQDEQLEQQQQQQQQAFDQQISNSIKKTQDIDNDANNNSHSKDKQLGAATETTATYNKQTKTSNQSKNGNNSKQLHNRNMANFDAGNNIADDSVANMDVADDVAEDGVDDVANAYKWQYLYRLHNNHLIKK